MYQSVFAFRPAKAEPLLFEADVKAYRTSEKPCAPELSIEFGGVGRAIEAAVKISTSAGVIRM